MAKILYKIRSAEKIIQEFEIVSGDTVDYAERKTLKAAQNIANKYLKNKNIYSVWIEAHAWDQYGKNWEGDYFGQWSKYENEEIYLKML
tara:strand:- start:189 stop:455 length:267 start_codon:yes stop_codon:yes gene_type:complete